MILEVKRCIFITVWLTISLLFCLACESTNDDQRQNLVIVLDGLRSDYITPELMPNLYNFGQEGVVAENHHAVYPTVTRVNSPSLATGSYPGTHGLMHNHIYLPEISGESIHTGDDVEALMSVDSLLTAVSIGEWIDLHGLTYFTGGSGSYGSSYLLNHTLASAGVWNSRGFIAPEPMKEQALEKLGDLPEIDRPNYAQNRWAVDAYLEVAVDEFMADAAILWITDPDRTAHTYGAGAPETAAALSHADEELGRLFRKLEERGKLEQTNIFITTDHGFSTHEGGFDLSAILQKHQLDDYFRIIGNSQLYMKNETDDERMRQTVRLLQEHPSVGAIFTRPAENSEHLGKTDGTLSMELINYNHERAADILVTAAWNDGTNEFGYAGASAQGGTAGHGTASPYELQITMIASGPDIKKGVVSSVPTGNIDIAPTILHLLDLPVPETMDGRIMNELLVDGPEPESVDFETIRYETTPVEWNPDFRMILIKAQTGESAYMQEAGITR